MAVDKMHLLPTITSKFLSLFDFLQKENINQISYNWPFQYQKCLKKLRKRDWNKK